MEITVGDTHLDLFFPFQRMIKLAIRTPNVNSLTHNLSPKARLCLVGALGNTTCETNYCNCLVLINE